MAKSDDTEAITDDQADYIDRWIAHASRFMARRRAAPHQAEIDRYRRAMVWAERVMLEEWGEAGPPGWRLQWEEFRGALDNST